jgi:hypothetical protein
MTSTHVVSIVLVLGMLAGCGDDDGPGGGDGDGGTGGGMDGGGSGGPDGSSGGGDGATGGSTQCTNGLDDDGDGLADGFDPECTGAADDDESSYATGQPGDNVDNVFQDCFFDGDSGHGNDGCMYRTGCLTGELPPEDPDCEISAMCLEFCFPGTPNGCDCFGCCEVTTPAGDVVTIRLDGTCDYENLDDTDACPRCTQSPDCTNDCGECELCPGRTEEDLPDSCTPDGGMGGYECEGGTTCGPGLTPCADDEYCYLGCCLPILI